MRTFFLLQIRSLSFALNTTLKDKTEKRVILQEFIHSLNRKKIIPNEEVDPLLKEGYRLIE